MRLLLILLLLLQDDPVAVDAIKGYQHPWAGFGDGCSITTRETMRQPDIDKSGQLVYKEVVHELTTTVMAQAGEKSTLKIEGAGQESYIPYFIAAFPNWARGRGEKKGIESVTVAGVSRACEVTQISLDTDKDAGQITIICKSPEVPYWAVKWRTETLAQGRPNTSEEEVVLDVNQRVKVGDREFSCVLVQSTVEAVGGAKTVKKEWRTEEIPGRVAKRESRQYLNGKEIESALIQMDVVRFKGKR